MLSVDSYIPYLVDGTTEQLVLPAVDAAEPDALPVDDPVEARGGKRNLKKDGYHVAAPAHTLSEKPVARRLSASQNRSQILPRARYAVTARRRFR